MPRDSFTVATKFFPGLHNDENGTPKCDQATVTTAVDQSLQNLGLEFVDLYYLHRMPPTLELAEEWMRSIKTCVEAGKVRNVGLSEVGPEWLRKLHAIHPVAAVQQEWSLITRNLEEKLVPVYRELDIAVVAYSPLARNLLVTTETAPPQDFRANQPRYSEENYQKNLELSAKIKAMADAKDRTAAQLSLAWIYYKAAKLGVRVVPIPGTTKVANAKDNIASLSTQLNDEEAGQLEALAAAVAGARGSELYQSMGIENQV
jgi:aryl-alcohol dehydrogenase-like predicted oxidoreductase